MNSADRNPFPRVSFTGKLRPSQADVVKIARQQLSAGKRQLHIVAPPGSGKTVLGLYLWAECIRQPCLVLSPNSAIQSQWAARTDLFQFPSDRQGLISTDSQHPNLLTSLTYQSVTLPARKNEHITQQAIELWCDRLIEAQQAQNEDEAKVWIKDLRAHNKDYYRQRLSSYSKQIRAEISISGDAISMLHTSSLATLQRIAQLDVGVVILDECHHLLGHWGRVLSDAMNILNWPIVIGLTATPPDRSGIDPRDLERYDDFFGDVDYEVPVPAVVKDGYLAPYQDLAYFVRPTQAELTFIASADQRLKTLVEDLCDPQTIHVPNEADDGLIDNEVDLDEGENEFDEEDERILHSFDVDAVPESYPLTNTLVEGPNFRSGDEDLKNASTAANLQAEYFQADNLVRWLVQTLAGLRLPTGVATTWSSFAKRDPQFALASRQFLSNRSIALPEGVPHLGPLQSPARVPQMQFWVPVLDRYVRHFLRRSPNKVQQELAKRITSSLRILGIQITETGTRACASPVGRVMAYSHSKTTALKPILSAEMNILGRQIRAVVIADFEKSSAVSEQIKHLMDEEAGGAIAAFKAILRDLKTDKLDPILVTGSTILIDNEIEPVFLQRSRQWLASRNLDVVLNREAVGDFFQITGSGRDWSPRVYVEMITEHFQDGLTRCLIGTRGLLGEGWDANKINVLIDITTVTTSMSINQLRGRSIRLDPAWQEKLANNWDVVCIAPEFNKGFDDYHRFIAKHRNLYGVTDDGAIEKGVGHVHPAFTEIKPEGLETSVALLNDEMILRAGWRNKVRGFWKIGQGYQGQGIKTVEAKLSRDSSETSTAIGFPPFAGSRDPWNDRTLTQAISKAVLATFVELGKIKSADEPIVNELAGGYLRVFLENATPLENELFASAMREILGPLDRPRYVIERIIEIRSDGFLSSILPHIVGKYFQKKKRHVAMLHAVPNELAINREVASVFERFWNRFVSPGQAIYAHRGAGEKVLAAAKQNGQQQAEWIHEKEVFR